LPQAVSFLAGRWQGPEPLDLSRTLVVVPTRQSGRRLREALASYAADRGSAVFPPRVLTAEAFVAQGEPAEAASRLHLTVAWIDVLRTVDLDAYREVFPVDPPARNFTWSLRLAEQLVRLQTTLAENGLSIGDVPERVGTEFPELSRWLQLAELERRCVDRLDRAGLTAGNAAPLPAARAVEALHGFDRVVLLACADPLPRAVALLQAASVITEVVVFAPAEASELFDEWGRPLPAAWSGRVLTIPHFAERVHLCAGPAHQAARIAKVGRDYSERDATTIDGLLAVGVADAEVLALLEGEASRAGLAVFNPEGEPRRNGALYHLVSALTTAAQSPTFAAIEALARCPDFLSYLANRCGPAFSVAHFLDGLDALRRKHLPSDLRAALGHAAGVMADALAAIGEVLRPLTREAFPDGVASVLTAIYGHRRLNPAVPAEAWLMDAAEEFTAALRASGAAAESFPGLSTAEWQELALRAFGETRRTSEKPAGAIELQGWLELLYEDAPHLIIAGLNDGMVPEAVSEDAFLPESLRLRLGLKTNAARFARDAYLLEAVAAPRANTGRLDLLLGKTSTAGDPLRPSRLLLRCPDEQLPERIRFLFRVAAVPDSHLPWTRAWNLRPRREPPPKQVAVTALRRWLACHFRFYLKYALRMEAIDAGKTEMDAFDFGTLCHGALEAMGRDERMRECTDAGVLREFLHHQLNRHAAATFGSELTLPLLIQMESARQRLGRFAELQARERAAGWGIEAVEQPFSVEIAGVIIRGKIDRIDRHAPTGAVRVLDYKTSDSGTAPRAAHLRSVRSDETLPEWATLSIDGKPRAWLDLQLPLYRQALAPKYGDAIGLGYVTLPKAIGETALLVWEDYTRELHDAAMRCAEGICAAIARGEFWPPNAEIRPDNDEFATLFHHGAAESVAWRDQG
jgi:ATP-dependent helicase/nuclease subunit B